MRVFRAKMFPGEVAVASRAHAMMPVSYTHLDVYKRQVRIRARAFHSRLIVEKLAEPHEIVLLDAEVKLLARRALQLGDQDVYKRQIPAKCSIATASTSA